MSLTVEFGFVTAVSPVAVRLKGDAAGVVVPVFGATGWTPAPGFEVAVLVDNVDGRKTRVCCIGPRNPI